MSLFGLAKSSVRAQPYMRYSRPALGSLVTRSSRPETFAGGRSHRRSLSATSVSSDEVEKFSSMDKSWWDPQSNPLMAMNTIRMQYIRELVAQELSLTNEQSSTSSSNVYNKPLAGCRALDVGCGGGLLSESLSRLGATVTGLDPSKDLVAAARKHAALDERTQSIDYRGGISVEDLARESADDSKEKFDIICILEVLEHVTDPVSILTAASSLLKDDGLLFLSTMNRTIKSHVGTIIGAEYILGLIPRGTHDWHQYRSPDEVRHLVEKCSLEEVDVRGMVVTTPPLFGNWDWKLDKKDTDINWIGTYRLKKDAR